jgi:hypothetical protein
MNVGRNTGGAAPRILSLSTKKGEFQATDIHHWRSTSLHLLNMELVGPFWMVSRRDRSLTPAGDRTTIPRSFTPWRIYKADSCHPGSNWMHLALDIDADGLYNCLSCWRDLYFVAGRGVWEEKMTWIKWFYMYGGNDWSQDSPVGGLRGGRYGVWFPLRQEIFIFCNLFRGGTK